MPAVRQNLLWIVLVLIAAGVLTVFVCPFFAIGSRWSICVLLYVVLALLLLYGWASAAPKKREPGNGRN